MAIENDMEFSIFPSDQIIIQTPVDSEMSPDSENPIQTKVVYEELEKKVDKEEGKQLSTEDYTTAEKGKLNNLPNLQELNDNFNKKVDKVVGKGLSANDYTTEDKAKLDGLPNSTQLIDEFNRFEEKANKVTNITEDSTDTQYPSAAAVWDLTEETKKTISEKIKDVEDKIVTVDTELSSTSANPVQNKVVTAALDGKVDKVDGKGLSTNDYTAKDKAKLDGLPTSSQMTGLFEEKANKVTNITEDSTDTQYPSAAAVWELVSPVGYDVYQLRYQLLPMYLADKQDKTTVVNIPDQPPIVTLTLGQNNTDTRNVICNTMTLQLVFPDGEYDTDYTQGLSFWAAETPTHVSYTSTGIIQWVGTDCFISDDNKSIFKPSANTHYDIVFYYNGGNYIVGLVNGYKTAVGNTGAN